MIFTLFLKGHTDIDIAVKYNKDSIIDNIKISEIKDYSKATIHRDILKGKGSHLFFISINEKNYKISKDIYNYINDRVKLFRNDQVHDSLRETSNICRLLCGENEKYHWYSQSNYSIFDLIDTPEYMSSSKHNISIIKKPNGKKASHVLKMHVYVLKNLSYELHILKDDLGISRTVYKGSPDIQKTVDNYINANY